MTQRRRVIVNRWSLGWAMLSGLLLATGAVVVAFHRMHSVSLATALGLDLAALAVAVVALGWLLPRLVWFGSGQPSGDAVVEVVLGREVVGHAVKVGRRTLVTSARTVRRALPDRAADGSAAEPTRRDRVRLRLPSGSDTGDLGVWARVVRWGPGRPGLRSTDVAVLRTTGHLPWWMPSLPLLPGRHEGPARLLTPGAGADRAVRVRDHELFFDGTADCAIGGAAVVVEPAEGAPAHWSAGGSQLAGIAAPIGQRRRGAGQDRMALPLVEPDDLRKVIGDVSRRRLLRAGAGAASLALTAGVASAVLTRDQPMRGAGWAYLFDNSAVKAFLADHGFHIADVKAVSGLAMLKESPATLAGYDFVTCPNQEIADRVIEMVNGQRPDRASATPYPLCSDEMVVAARRDILPILANRDCGLLARPKDADDRDPPRLDIRRYLEYFGQRWGTFDPKFRDAGNQIMISGSDPLKAGGGEMLLMLLRDAGWGPDQPQLLKPVSSLWDEEGPLGALSEPSTETLLDTLIGKNADMVFAYAHDAAYRLSKWDPEAGPEKFVLLRTLPHVRFDQVLVGISDRGHDLGRLFELMRRPRSSADERVGRELGDLLYEQLCVWGNAAALKGEGFTRSPFPELMRLDPATGFARSPIRVRHVVLPRAEDMRGQVAEMKDGIDARRFKATQVRPGPSVGGR